MPGVLRTQVRRRTLVPEVVVVLAVRLEPQERAEAQAPEPPEAPEALEEEAEAAEGLEPQEGAGPVAVRPTAVPDGMHRPTRGPAGTPGMRRRIHRRRIHRRQTLRSHRTTPVPMVAFVQASHLRRETRVRIQVRAGSVFTKTVSPNALVI
jgi:hypothetical protein